LIVLFSLQALGTDLPELLQRLPHHSSFHGTTARPEIDSEDEDKDSEDRPLRKGLSRTATRSRYAPAKQERDMAAIMYSIIVFTLVLFFTTVVGGGVAMKMGYDMGPLLDLLKP